MQFIDRLPGNICFVAHNGNRFDYPIFLSEVERIQKVLEYFKFVSNRNYPYKSKVFK